MKKVSAPVFYRACTMVWPVYWVPHDHNGEEWKLLNILLYISRSKDNKTMKFGQIIEYQMRNTFPKKHAQNMVEKLV